MKNRDIFLEQIKSEMLSPYSLAETFSLPDTGNFRLRLLPRRGDMNVIPHHKARVHFVSLRSNSKKDPIHCLGRNCPICELVDSPRVDGSDSLRGATRLFFHAVRGSKIGIFSAPMSFLEGLYGSPGQPSDVTKLALKGISIFDPTHGRELLVQRENTDQRALWFIQVSTEEKPLSASQIEDLAVAPRLSDSYWDLTKEELEVLSQYLQKLTTQLPRKLERLGSAKV